MIASAPGSRFERASNARDQLARDLLGHLNERGHWSGELSSSALSTAVATIALGELDRQFNTSQHLPFVERGLRWLAGNANSDGGWGDTIRSKSNISTTALCWAAFGAARADDQFRGTVAKAVSWLSGAAGSLENLPQAIAARYGRDRTFSVPILMTCALSGRLGSDGWRKVPALPFELATFPRSWFGALKLPVVSYALPALIAIGQVIHHHAPSRNPVARLIRNSARPRTLDLLTELQPANGGFLEATPLTAFVTMSLASAGHPDHPVAQKGADFLRASIRPDGSWPIDTNLATWVTTLSIKALSDSSAPHALNSQLSSLNPTDLTSWLLNQQYNATHPYTGAPPGGWAWTDLPGGVPDADDTAGALFALHHLGDRSPATIRAAEQGIQWLLNLQNSDGGIPTFCRGWGTLPFDRSTPELTAHALRAFHAWRSTVNPTFQNRIDRSTARALRFLSASQEPSGAFIPLWFGNEHAQDDGNPVYGTAQVLIAMNDLVSSGISIPQNLVNRAAKFLARVQLSTGGWGGDQNLPETIEETALALEALVDSPEHRSSAERGLDRLLQLIEERRHDHPSPIGFYFARLWYFERLYPLIFATSALTAACSRNRGL
jgi:squalene-hopene/tetraprenyl-beta-curcumene cyclase